MSNPKISVIIPVYNAAQYLEKCLDSVLAQTFTDFELLLIDDGSKDSSGEICDRYAESDSRIRVFHKPNGGVSSARNLGLDNAKGEWIAFCDSDDYVTDKYLEDLYNEAMTTGADLVVQDFVFVKESGVVIPKWYNPIVCTYNLTKSDKIISEQKLLSRGYSFCKMFSHSIIRENEIRYPENMRFGEDLCFVLQYLTHAPLVSCSDIANYIYIDHPNSAIHKKHSFINEYKGWRNIVNAMQGCIKTHSFTQECIKYSMNNILMYLHRAITVIRSRDELNAITDEDWILFDEYFQPVSRKTAIDLWMLRHFNKVPFVILPYLRFCVFIRRNLLKYKLNTLVDILKSGF